MLIIGHKHILAPKFIKLDSNIESKDAIYYFSSKDIDSSLELANKLKEKELDFAIIVNSIKEFILLSALSPKYLLTESLEQVREFQQLAEHYLLDSKVIKIIEDINEIEVCAKLGIDGVIFKEHLK